MSLDKPDYQLRLALDLDDGNPSNNITDTSPAGRGELSVDEIRLRSETARAALASIDLPWKEDYLKLVEGGWDWRVAAYIAWAASPKNLRSPKTQDELARLHLGLTSDRAINTWRRKNPAIDEMVAIMQAAPLWERRAEIYAALIAVATTHEYKGHNDRKLALELLGDYVPKSKIEAELNKKLTDDLASLPFEEKLRLAGLTDPEKLEQFKRSLARSDEEAGSGEDETS